MTAVEYLIEKISENIGFIPAEKHEEIRSIFKEAKKREEKMIEDAIMYSLDEDGHTGDWKLRFAHKYYKEISSNEK